MGWHCLEPLDQQLPKSIICVAPHTSNWDFILGKLYYLTISKPHSFLMKKDWFFFPLGYIFKALGGIPIDRSRNSGTTDRIVEYIKKQEEIHIAITPEGSRSYRKDWKTGFYRIALEAGIPIELAVIDYPKKELGIFEVFYPSGDIDVDLAYIRSAYNSKQAKYPDKFHDYVKD